MSFLNPFTDSNLRYRYDDGSKAEERAREIFETLTGYRFIKCRPKWLDNLELDGFCRELKLAFEYNGPPHFDPDIYSTGNHLRDMLNIFNIQNRDAFKIQRCEELGVKLISINQQTISLTCLRKYILNSLINIYKLDALTMILKETINESDKPTKCGLTKDELKELCRKFGLSQTGNKKELALNLIDYINYYWYCIPMNYFFWLIK